MPNQLPVLLIFASLVVSILFIILGVFLIVTRMFKFTSDLLGIVEKDKNKEADQIKAEATANAQKIMEDARITSLNTIRDSSNKASEILKDAGLVGDLSTQKIQEASAILIASHDSKIRELSDQMMSNYNQLLKEVTDADSAKLHENVTQIEAALVSQLNSFNTQLSTELTALTATLTSELRLKYDKADQDVLEYKNTKIKKIDENIYKILELVSVEILGDVVNLTQTEAFIEKTVKEKIHELQ